MGQFRVRKSAVPLLIAFLLAGGLVYRASNAAFTGSTSNADNEWTAGSVSLTNNAPSGSAVFAVTNAKPGDTGTKCINVTYGGTLNAAVKLYVTNPSGDLGQYLTLVVTEGTGATDVNCTGFAAGSVLTAGGGDTLTTFTTAHNSYATGVSAWTPAGSSNAVRSYRITWTLQDNNAAQGDTAQADFTWEARNT